ncbi:MAG: hypothetical protein GXP16_12960, partial [Gammaproteobacteria bacterium]|nr:hypothetical protein [Gammaproteobacteria bacterium]
GKSDELDARGWSSAQDIQGHEEEIRDLIQDWASDFDSVRSFERAIDSTRLPLGEVKPLANVHLEDWAQQRAAFVELNINGTHALIPRSPARFSNSEVGPKGGAFLRGADNRTALKRILGMSDFELDELTDKKILAYEPPLGQKT